jgi:aminopeptidase-like protein
MRPVYTFVITYSVSRGGEKIVEDATAITAIDNNELLNKEVHSVARGAHNLNWNEPVEWQIEQKTRIPLPGDYHPWS